LLPVGQRPADALRPRALRAADGDHGARLRGRRGRPPARAHPLAPGGRDGGDEGADGKGDSAAVVYLTWKQTLRWYTLKYVWSAVGKRGAVCARKRNPFVAQDTIILETGEPLNAWKLETID